MKFSEKIVRLRRIRGITQDELASAVGVSRQAVYKWECGQSYPEVAKLLELKALFGISIDDLLDESYEIALPDKKKRKRIKKARAAAIEREVEATLPTEAPDVQEEEEEITVVEVEATPALEEAEVLVEEAEASPSSEEESPAQEREETVEVIVEEQTSEEPSLEEAMPGEQSEVVAEEDSAIEGEEAIPGEEIRDVSYEAAEDVEEAEAPIEENAPKPEKKRGFFSRLFGRR